MIEGKAIYDQEIMELLKRFDAKGIVLLVIEGNKNKSDLEFGSALRVDDIPRISRVLRHMADTFDNDLTTILFEKQKERGQSHGKEQEI